MATFLIISPEPWTAHAVSKHHYALTLASRGHDVLFLDPPTAGPELTISSVPEAPRVRVVEGPPVARGLRYLPRAVRHYLEARWLAQLEERSGLQVEVVWLFENSRFYEMAFAGKRLKIYHQVDLNQNFHPHAAAHSADICFCTTDVIRDELLQATPRVYKIHHGTPVVPVPPSLTQAQRDCFANTGGNAAYVGNLAMGYLDVDLLLATVRAHSNVRFHFIGGYAEDTPLRVQGKDIPNIIWWGKQPSVLIPSLLAQVDVVMCTYQASHHRDQASPHKLMEYLASGKTIVATYTDEYKDKRELLCMVDANEHYVAAFGDVVANLAFHNGMARSQQRRAFAAAHSYDTQLDRIVRLVREASPRHAGLFQAAQEGRVAEAVA